MRSYRDPLHKGEVSGPAPSDDEVHVADDAVGGALFSRHPMPMWIQDAETGRIMAVNDAAVRHYGLSHEQFLRLHYGDLLTEPAPGERLHDRDAVKFARDGDVVTHRVQDGQCAWMSLTVSPCALQGKPALLVMAHDVTRQLRDARLLKETLAEVHRLQEAEQQERRTADQARQAQAALSHRLQDVQARERRALARELHDEIGQSLSAIRVQFAKLRRRVQGPELLDLIDAASGMAEHTLGSARNLSLMLHPPQLDTLGLEAALRWHTEQVARLHPLEVRLDADTLPRTVHPDLSIAVYRMVQEALSNVVKHARATQVHVRLAADEDGILLDITDDGQGFDLAALQERWQDFPSLGLSGMQERARQLGGSLTVSSQPGKGTRIAAKLRWR